MGLWYSLEPLGKGSSAGQSQPPLMPDLGSLGINNKVICVWFLLVLGVEVLERGYAKNQGQVPLVPDLWLLSWRYVTG